MPKFAHIINPVIVNKSSDLFVAQPITFETMKIARDYALESEIEVELYSAQYLEDSAFVPEYFTKTPDLDRSVLDLKAFQVSRKLPILKDILDRLYNATDADYLIYTNVDIALMPSFYIAVARIIEQGYDSFTINRRSIPDCYQTLEDLPLMFAEVGKKHKGYDCFVFSRNAYLNYQLNQICVGIPHIGNILAINLICNSQNFQAYKELHLTFHIGEDSYWKQKSNNVTDYVDFNKEQARQVIEQYMSIDRLNKHELIDHYINYYFPELREKESDRKFSVRSLIKIFR
jgi:hypothetical protein